MAFIGQSFSTHSLPQDAGGEFTPLPEGWYDVVVKSSELKPTKDGSGQYISLRLTVEGPTHAGRGIFTNLNITNRSPDAERIGRSQLRTILELSGIDEFSDTDQLIGARFAANVKVRAPYVDKTGQQRDADNEVKGYRAASNAASKPSFAAQSAPAFAQQPAAFQQPQVPAFQQAPVQPAQSPSAPASPPWAAAAPQQAAPQVIAGYAPPWAAPQQ